MGKIKLTYVLELEVPEEELLVNGDRFVHDVRRMLGWNCERGWKATLKRLVGMAPIGVMKNHAPSQRPRHPMDDALH